MIDWTLPPDLQEKYDQIVATTRRLQIELGIKPMTLEERHQEYLKKQNEKRKQEELRQEELRKLQERIGKHRPLPKWKV